jgi:dienelactone hydrolase
MKKSGILFLIPFVILANTGVLTAQKKITFSSKDGLTITADLYSISDTLPYMILCHQAGYSRGEYKETARKFNKFNYNCIAIDARSGEEINEVKNETATLAIKLNKPVNYLDAEQDIIAALDYAYKQSKKKVVLVGSSYSASLALKIGATNDKVKAVIAFSPGEYFGDNLNLKENIKTFNKPLFVTSTKDEAANVTALIKDVKSSQKQQFIPIEQGMHGSKTLWKSTSNHSEYWIALFMFMREIK